jgi:hypothetical protein
MTSHLKTPDQTPLHEKQQATQPQSPTASLVLFDRWLRSIPLTPATGWRYRKRGWITTVNVCGRVFITKDEIAKFESRAVAGEFSRVHKTPSRQSKTDGGDQEATA